MRLVNGIIACSPCLRTHKNMGVAYPLCMLLDAFLVWTSLSKLEGFEMRVHVLDVVARA